MGYMDRVSYKDYMSYTSYGHIYVCMGYMDHVGYKDYMSYTSYMGKMGHLVHMGHNECVPTPTF